MLEDRKTRNMVKKILAILRSYNASPETVRYVFKKVREEGKYQVPKKRKSLPDFLNDAEIDHLLNQALNIDSTTSMIAHIGVFTGLRVSEMRNLKIQDIDFVNRQLKVVSGKNSKDRQVPLSTGLMQHIKAYVGSRRSGYLFVKSNYTPYTVRSLQKKVEKLLERCSFSKKLSTHSLRHTFGTLCRRKGMSLETIQVLMGHSSKSTTEIYAHIELGPVKDQYIRMIGME